MEKAGIVIRDLLRADSTLETLLARDSDICVFYSYVDAKNRFGKTYPYIRIDAQNCDISDWSNDGAIQKGIVRLKMTCLGTEAMSTHKIADRASKAILEAHSTLVASGLTLTSHSMSSSDQEMPEGVVLTIDGITLTCAYVGNRS